MVDTYVTPVNQSGSAAKSSDRPAAEQSGQAAQAAKGSAPEPGRIAARAYDLYLQRNRKDGGAVEDWLKAEQQLLVAVSHK